MYLLHGILFFYDKKCSKAIVVGNIVLTLQRLKIVTYCDKTIKFHLASNKLDSYVKGRHK